MNEKYGEDLPVFSNNEPHATLTRSELPKSPGGDVLKSADVLCLSIYTLKEGQIVDCHMKMKYFSERYGVHRG